jgi:hypothetical protein
MKKYRLTVRDEQGREFQCEATASSFAVVLRDYHLCELINIEPPELESGAVLAGFSNG